MSAASLYEEALRAFPPAGSGVHAHIMRCARLAAFAELPAAQVAQEITRAMPRSPNPPNEVAATVGKAYQEQDQHAALGGYVPPRPPKPRPAPKAARRFRQRGAGATEADLWEASPRRIDWGEDFRLDAVAQLQALFLPGELVFCGDRFGKTVRPAEDWISDFRRGRLAVPEFFIPNPLRPEGGRTAAGPISPRCDAAVAAHRHAVAEMDEMPLTHQLAFWAGWGLQAVSAVTYSGGKSYHVLLRVDAADAGGWARDVREGLFRRRLIPLGCDGTCQNPSRLSRLAGAFRADKGGTVQRLLFVARPLAGWEDAA